jgi:membrane protease YdiL (CAAX protease family)
LKDAARLLAYFVTTILFGALAGPVLFWTGQSLALHGIFPALAAFNFESYFHRALILGALIFLWPFLRWFGIKKPGDLGLSANRHWLRDLGVGFFVAALPVVVCEVVLIRYGIYSMRPSVSWSALARVVPPVVVVPLIEEPLFRGLFLGILLGGLRPWRANAISAGIFSIVHFLKAPEQPTAAVQWNSGFVSLARSFDQFGEPILVLAGFTTLFVIGLVLAYTRLQTRSLWLPIGLHGGWILASMAFGRLTHREVEALPWLGKSFLVGLVPLAVCLISWVWLRAWFKCEDASDS